MNTLRVALVALSLVAASSSAADAPPAAATPQAGAAAPATPTSAASAAPATQLTPVTRIGLGVGIGTGDGSPALYVPVEAGPVRIELDGAYARFGTRDANVTTARLGLGIFGLVPIAPAIRCDAGARFRYARDDLSGAHASEAIRIAAVLGGEWAPAPAFSIGVEGQVGYSAGLGDAVSGLDVSAQAILRVFLATGKPSRSASAGASQDVARPARLKKCQHSTECERPDICFDGYCRR